MGEEKIPVCSSGAEKEGGLQQHESETSRFQGSVYHSKSSKRQEKNGEKNRRGEEILPIASFCANLLGNVSRRGMGRGRENQEGNPRAGRRAENFQAKRKGGRT